MAQSVTGLFTHQAQVDSVVGALRDAGFEAERILVVDPDAAAAPAPVAEAPVRRGIGAWLIDHLVHHGVAHDHAQRYHDLVADGRRLVSVSITKPEEDADARNLLVTAGAEEISSAADGKMVHVWRPGEA